MATINDIPVFNAVIDGDDELGMYKISLVDDPAVMSDFQAFDNTKKQMLYSIANEEKRLVRGVVMRANFPIYRFDYARGEYYIIYKPDVIRKMAEKYLKDGLQNSVNVMHNTDVEGVQMVQFYIKGDGVKVEGFDEIADGSLFAEFHITNDEIWEQIKAGSYKGFSLEGWFALESADDQATLDEIANELEGKFKKLDRNKMAKVKGLMERLRKALEVGFGNMTTDKGILAWEGDNDIAVGDDVFVEDSEGNRTPAEDGEYTNTENDVIVVAEGKVAEIKSIEGTESEETEEEVAEPIAEEQAEEVAEEVVVNTIDTDKGVLSYEGEFAVGVAVTIDGEPAPSDTYKTAESEIVVEDGVVTAINEIPAEKTEEEIVAPEIDEEKEALRREVAELRKQVEKLSQMSIAKPAHQEVEDRFSATKTGNKGLDRLAKILSSK